MIRNLKIRMLRIKAKLLILAVCCFLAACDARIAENKEPVFNSFKPESKEYRTKLAEKIVNSQKELTYVFEKYIDDNTIEIIVSGHAFAANCTVIVNDWKGLEEIKDVQGDGYRGAELDGLQLEVEGLGDPKGEIFLYKDINYIID